MWSEWQNTFKSITSSLVRLLLLPQFICLFLCYAAASRFIWLPLHCLNSFNAWVFCYYTCSASLPHLVLLCGPLPHQFTESSVTTSMVHWFLCHYLNSPCRCIGSPACTTCSDSLSVHYVHCLIGLTGSLILLLLPSHWFTGSFCYHIHILTGSH